MEIEYNGAFADLHNEKGKGSRAKEMGYVERTLGFHTRKLEDSDLILVTDIVGGGIRWRRYLDHLIGSLCDDERTFRNMEPLLLQILYRFEPVSSSTMDNLPSIMADNLPEEILLEILSQLPADTVLKFQRVCKTWRNLLSLGKTNFAAMHFSRHTLRQNVIDSSKVSLIFLITSERNKRTYCHRLHHGEEYDDDTEQCTQHILRLINHPLQKRWNISCLNSTSLVGSCNGLICVSEHEKDLFICNPITGEYFYLPGFLTSNQVYSGFGYNPKTNEYKVVQILYDMSSGRGHLEVYTLGAGSGWRNKGVIVITSSFRALYGVCFNGALHWLPSNKNDIMVFDLSDEKFHVLPPVPVVGENTSILGSHGEWLCVSGWKTPVCLDIWTFKKNIAATDRKDESWSWCKEFSLTVGNSFTYHYCRPLVVVKSGFVLFKYADPDHPAQESKLFCYDPKTATWKTLGIWKDFDVIPHTNSFVSLKALGEKTWRERKKWPTS